MNRMISALKGLSVFQIARMSSDLRRDHSMPEYAERAKSLEDQLDHSGTARQWAQNPAEQTDPKES